MRMISKKILPLSGSRRSGKRRSRLLGERGGALVETAVMMPMFLIILIGVAEVGRLAYYAIEVTSAAYAGAAYGAQNHADATATTNIGTAASTDAANVTGLTTTSSLSCTCTSGTTITCATASNCVSPGRIVEYVTVNTSASISPIFNFGVSTTWTLHGQSTLRVVE